MKVLLLMIALLPILQAKGQIKTFKDQPVDSTRWLMRKAGKELISFQRSATTGIAMQGIGMAITSAGAIFMASATNTSAYGKKPDNTGAIVCTVLGGTTSIIGFIIYLTSYQHARNAGIYLRGKNLEIDLFSPDSDPTPPRL